MESDFELIHRIAEWMNDNIETTEWNGDLSGDIKRLLEAAEDVANYQDMRDS